MMVKYTTVDAAALRRLWDALQRKGRAQCKYRASRDCNKTVFVRRLLNKLVSGKYYAAQFDVPTGFKVMREDDTEYKEFTVKRKSYVYVTAITYVLGWGEELAITYIDAIRDFPSSKKFGYNELLKLRWKEISKAEYEAVALLFKADSE